MLTPQKREQEHVIRDKQQEISEQNEQLVALQREGQEKQDALRNTQNKLAALDSHQGQLLSQLQQANRDAAAIWEHLQKNKDKLGFEKEVSGPPMLNCSVKDPRYSNQIQAHMQASDFFCFTSQTIKDHKRLSDIVFDELELSATLRSCTVGLDSFRRPMSQAELNALGLDGYVIDYLDGPEPVLAMLCSTSKLHLSAVALGDISEEQYNNITKDKRITHFIAGKQSYARTSRPEYGPHAVSTRVQQIRPGRFWTDKPVDDSVKRGLQNQLAGAAGELHEMRRKLVELTESVDVLKQEISDIRKKLVRSSLVIFWIRSTDTRNRRKYELRKTSYKRNTAFGKLSRTESVGFHAGTN